MIAKSKKPNPYPGPRPFKPEESGIFFGREREVRELVSLITAHRTVLLYAQSGAGKTSLLNAGVIPLLTREGFEVLPVARVRGFEPEDIDLKEIPNIYVFNTLLGWAGDNEESRSLVSTSIGTFLKEREHLTDEQGLPLPRVAIFDQFEELFTSYPDRWEEREGFFHQITEALGADPLLRILFVIREDYLASLDSYIDYLPERMRTRYRLERLRAEAACQAVERPLRDTGRKFAEGVALSLVNKLLNIRIENAVGDIVETPGEYVEPVQLQVVCQSLWQNLPRDVTVITSDHLEEFGDVQEALRSFYEKAIKTAKRETGVSESDLRAWFNDKLITPAGTRGTVFRGKEQTEEIPNLAVDLLEAQHIIRAEIRAGARWYELTHDRLIEPIRKSNADKQTRSARRLRLLAAALVVMLTLMLVVAGTVGYLYLKQKPFTVKWSLTTNVVDGSIRRDPNKANYYHGERVILEAVPEPGYRFTNWSGDLSGSTNPTKLVIDADKSVTASFALKLKPKPYSKTYGLTTNAVDGSVTIDPNKANYHHGETVTLTAVPTVEYRFKNWSGDLSGSTNPTTLVMDDHKTVNASFALKTYSLTTTAADGSVTMEANYYHGEKVTLEAVPTVGYRFTNWSGDLSGSTNPTKLVMNADKTVTANFALKTYLLDIPNVVGGSVMKSPDKARYNHGETVTLTALVDPNYVFDDWSDDLSGSTNPTTLVMDADKTVTANFALKNYVLDIPDAVGGSVMKSPDKARYNHGETVTLTALVDPNYVFDGWSDDLSGSTNPTTLVMDADKTVTANFALKNYSLTVTAAGGSVMIDPNKDNYYHGERVILEAVPEPGYSFTKWSGDLSGSTNPTKLVMKSDKSVTATFIALEKFEVETNSIGMKLVYIPAGKFKMGSPLNEKGRFRDEGPQHEVIMSEAFWLGQTEVTQGQYRSVMNAQPWSGRKYVQEGINNPAVYVSWDDAAEFCRKLGQKEGKTYRLPTEAEWEYACRAGTTTPFGFDDPNSLHRESLFNKYAWYRRNTFKKRQKNAHTVGEKEPNHWGLYDMHGNVKEWCSDWYDKDYYFNSPSVDPDGPSTGKYRITRGGSWYNSVSYLRCADRYGCSPDFRHRSFGFRVVRSQ